MGKVMFVLRELPYAALLPYTDAALGVSLVGLLFSNSVFFAHQ